MIRFLLIIDASEERTSAGVAAGDDCRKSAATPAVCGDAIEVPSQVAVVVSPKFEEEVMPAPGAYQSTQEPWLENDALASDSVEAPMVRAAGTRAGEYLHAL